MNRVNLPATLGKPLPGLTSILDRDQIRRDAEGRWCLNDLWKMDGGDITRDPRHWFFLDTTKQLLGTLAKENVGKSDILCAKLSQAVSSLVGGAA